MCTNIILTRSPTWCSLLNKVKWKKRLMCNSKCKIKWDMYHLLILLHLIMKDPSYVEVVLYHFLCDFYVCFLKKKHYSCNDLEIC